MSKPIRVLLVEDQFFARLALRTVFEERDDMTVVAEADNGVSAMAQHRVHRPDVTVMDLRLPGMPGFDVMRRIIEDSPGARFVVLSNYEGSEDIHRALESGAMAYLTKSASADELCAAVSAVHQGRRFLPAAVQALLSDRLPADELTARELEVLQCLAEGMSNKEIASRLNIADKTARIHVSHILEKLGVSDRTQAAVTAIRRGIVHID